LSATDSVEFTKRLLPHLQSAVQQGSLVAATKATARTP